MHRRVKEQNETNKRARDDSGTNHSPTNKKLSSDNGDEHRKMVLEKQLKRAEKLRKKLQRSEEKAARAADALARENSLRNSTSTSTSKVQGGDDDPADVQPVICSDEQDHSMTTKAVDLNEAKRHLEGESRKLPMVSGNILHQKVNLGLDYDSNTSGSEMGGESDDLLSISTSDSESESESDISSSDVSDNDSAPEAESSKLSNPTRGPPSKAKTQHQKTEVSICSAYKKTGKCRYGRHCKFLHPAREAGQERKTRKRLYDRVSLPR